MEHIWIPVSIFAALMQAVRTAAQKDLNQRMSTMGTTYVRSIFGLPVMITYLVAVLLLVGGGAPRFRTDYLLYCFGGALAQVLATALLIYMFRLKNFAVGTMLTKTDIVMTALIGTFVFSETITPKGWIALVIVVLGVLMLSAGRIGLAKLSSPGSSLLSSLVSWPTQVALACALLFTFSYLLLREATLTLGDQSYLWRGAWTVVVATGMQVIFLGIWLLWKEPTVFGQLWPNRRISSFIGFTSALGSIGWFSAFALQNASYVRAVGQVEVVFTLLISWLYFRERVSPLELAGIVVTVAGILLFRLL
ncbi:MAG: DMT family transporter [Hyphomicrobiaceae bacterium]|nr:DMT family transporter [Hyphomicrobiaceae bacterium]